MYGPPDQEIEAKLQVLSREELTPKQVIESLRLAAPYAMASGITETSKRIAYLDPDGTEFDSIAVVKKPLRLKQKTYTPWPRHPHVIRAHEVFAPIDAEYLKTKEFVGAIDEIAAQCTFIDDRDQRIYEICCAYATRMGDERVLKQLEVEYKGIRGESAPTHYGDIEARVYAAALAVQLATPYGLALQPSRVSKPAFARAAWNRTHP